MSRYHLGERVQLGADAAALRGEATRPDGKLITRDWNPGPWTLRPDRPGIWTYTLYRREGSTTRTETGMFEVMPAAPRRRGFLARLLRAR